MEKLALRLLKWSDTLLWNEGSASSDGYYSTLPVVGNASGLCLTTPHGYVRLNGLSLKHVGSALCFWGAYRLNVLHD
jgi:hypothetical protein